MHAWLNGCINRHMKRRADKPRLAARCEPELCAESPRSDPLCSLDPLDPAPRIRPPAQDLFLSRPPVPARCSDRNRCSFARGRSAPRRRDPQAPWVERPESGRPRRAARPRPSRQFRAPRSAIRWDVDRSICEQERSVNAQNIRGKGERPRIPRDAPDAARARAFVSAGNPRRWPVARLGSGHRGERRDRPDGDAATRDAARGADSQSHRRAQNGLARNGVCKVGDRSQHSKRRGRPSGCTEEASRGDWSDDAVTRHAMKWLRFGRRKHRRTSCHACAFDGERRRKTYKSGSIRMERSLGNQGDMLRTARRRFRRSIPGPFFS